MSLTRSENPIWFFNNLTGQPLDDRYYAFFLQNVLPYNFQNVWKDPNRINVWSNPIQFGPNGGLPDNIYFDPNLVYRIQVREGNTTADQLIYDIQNYIPNGGGGGSSSSSNFAGVQNLITNPQFGNINFANNSVNPYTITMPGTYPIAPGWNLVLTGTGSTTLLQVQLPGTDFSTVPPITGNPPTALQINNTGWTSAQLVQTVLGNGAIFSNGSVSMSALLDPSSAGQAISLSYFPSLGSPIVIATSNTLSPGIFSILSGAVNIPTSINTNTGNAAFVNFVITLAPTGQIEISNVQVLGQSVPLAVSPAPTASVPLFQELSPEQIVNNEFNAYANSLIMQPKNSILTGWNFALNPFQFSPVAQTTATSIASYIADQTIMVQQTASSFTTGQSNIPANSLLFLEPQTSTANRVAIIQYIDPVTIRPYWGDVLSILANVSNTSSNPASMVRLKARLIWRSTLPSTIGNAEPIVSWPAGGDPVFSAGWTAIAPLNDPAYVLPINAIPPLAGLAFNGFQMPATSAFDQTLGVVIYTMDNVSNITTDSLLFDKISLVPNDFALEANPQTFDQVLRECQLYYETSYNPFTVPGAASGTLSNLQSQQSIVFAGGNVALYPSVFDYRFNTMKRAAPTLKFYAPSDASSGNTDVVMTTGGSVVTTNKVAIGSYYSSRYIGKKGFQYVANTNTAIAGPISSSVGAGYGYIAFQFTANACLGNPTLP
jgi:hypothetical protein